jgi:uncharacterized SAM-binding protein YcdF (DUF218 family)
MIVRALKWGTLIVIIGLVALGSYWGYLYRQIRNCAVRDEAHAADAIVILGAAQYNGRPSPVFKARLDHALELYRKGYSHELITTGSFGPDPKFSEAHVGTQYLLQHHVDPEAIITEQGSGSTTDIIKAVSGVLQAKQWTTVLVVSDGFHLFRLKRMFEDNGIQAYTSPAPNSPIEAASSQRLFYSIREVLLFSAYRITM